MMLFRIILIGLCLSSAATLSAPASAARHTPPLLLADDERLPSVTISWPTRDGDEITISGDRPYRSPVDARHLGHNINVYIALGGTRLDWGQGHPDGAIIRVGLYKREPRRPFFHNIADHADVTIALRGIHMNQPVIPRPATGLMHLQYMEADLLACGLGDDARDLFITADAADPLLALLPSENIRIGALAGGPAGGSGGPDPSDDPLPVRGTIDATVEPDGSVSIRWRFPYALLRHLQDPYQRTTPGGFFEPQHFHLELELLSAASSDAPEVQNP